MVGVGGVGGGSPLSLNSPVYGLVSAAGLSGLKDSQTSICRLIAVLAGPSLRRQDEYGLGQKKVVPACAGEEAESSGSAFQEGSE